MHEVVGLLCVMGLPLFYIQKSWVCWSSMLTHKCISLMTTIHMTLICSWHKHYTHKMLKRSSLAVNGTLSHSYGTSLAIRNHTVLPTTRHKRTCPALTPAMQARIRFTYPGGREGWVDLIAPWPGVETATFRSKPMLNHCTTMTTNQHIHVKVGLRRTSCEVSNYNWLENHRHRVLSILSLKRQRPGQHLKLNSPHHTHTTA